MTSTSYSLENQAVSFRELAQKLDNDNLQSFRLEHVQVSGDEDDMLRFAKIARGHPSLQEFALIDVQTTDDHTNFDNAISCLMVSAQCIQTIHIEHTKVSTPELATAAYCGTLRELLLRDIWLQDADVAIVAKAIAQNQTITTVDLSQNQLTDQGCKALERSLDQNTRLSTLRLDGNGGITGAEFTRIEAKLVGRVASAA